MDWKEKWGKWLRLPWWALLLLTVVSAAGLTVVFVKGWEEAAAAYALYVLAFYTLTVDCFACVTVLPGWCQTVKQKINGSMLGSRYMTDIAFRTGVSLGLSLAINLVYALVNVLSWYLYHSWWFLILAVYYVIMAVMWFLLVRYVRKQQVGSSMVGEWKRSRICAYILLLVNLTLSGAVLMILYQNKGYDYHGILIYVMALYTFYMTIHAIVELVKYRKLESPVLTAAKIVSLSAALVSMLNLETAMFSQFGGDMALSDQRIMIAATGGGVSVAVVTMSVLLIVRATKEIRRYQYGE